MLRKHVFCQHLSWLPLKTTFNITYARKIGRIICWQVSRLPSSVYWRSISDKVVSSAEKDFAIDEHPVLEQSSSLSEQASHYWRHGSRVVQTMWLPRSLTTLRFSLRFRGHCPVAFPHSPLKRKMARSLAWIPVKSFPELRRATETGKGKRWESLPSLEETGWPRRMVSKTEQRIQRCLWVALETEWNAKTWESTSHMQQLFQKRQHF